MKQLGDLLDEHVDWEESPDSDPKGAKGKKGEGEGRSTYTKDELKKIRDEIKENMISPHRRLVLATHLKKCNVLPKN